MKKLRFRVGRAGILLPYTEMDLSGDGETIPSIREVIVAPIGDTSLGLNAAHLMQKTFHYPGIIKKSAFQLR
jgi:hypothetical protein